MIASCAGKSYPFESDVKFRKPVFLPSRAAFKIYKATDPKVTHSTPTSTPAPPLLPLQLVVLLTGMERVAQREGV
jgi:hypothetical protein